MNSASPREAILHRPKSYDIGRYRTTQKKNQNQTIDYRRKEKECISLSLWFFLSEKNIKTGVQPEDHHIQEEQIMKAVMNREIVEISIKEQLAQLISKYSASQQSLADSVRALNQKYKEDVQTKTYTPEHLREVYEENKAALLAAAAEKAKALNASARGAVEHLSGKAVPALSASEKPADYAVRISNALQFIQLEGAAISDETAAQILRDFTGDMETMQRFRSVLEKQIAPSDRQIADQYGNTTFPQTFGQLFKYEKFRDALAELQEMADTLFVRKLSQTETEYLHGATLSVPTDGYMQLVTERNIIEQAETVESMISELFTTTE